MAFLPIMPTMQCMAKARKKKRSEAESPTSDCLLICDDVLVSHGKDKHFLQGIIGTIIVRSLPATIGGYVAYVRLTNVYPSQSISLTFEDADSNEELFRFNANLPQKSDPLGVYTLVLKIPPFGVTHPGRYIFCARHGGVPFAQSPIRIVLLEEISDEKPHL